MNAAFEAGSFLGFEQWIAIMKWLKGRSYCWTHFIFIGSELYKEKEVVALMWNSLPIEATQKYFILIDEGKDKENLKPSSPTKDRGVFAKYFNRMCSAGDKEKIYIKLTTPINWCQKELRN